MDEEMIVAGIGCRKGVSADAVVAALDAALAACALERSDLGALAAVAGKADEAGIGEAALLIGLPLVTVSDEQLSGTADRLLSHSAQSLEATGTGSASEAAALAVAGPGARLLAPRVALGHVTCAIAAGEAEA